MGGGRRRARRARELATIELEESWAEGKIERPSILPAVADNKTETLPLDQIESPPLWPIVTSQAAEDWEFQRNAWGAIEPIEDVMKLVGLECVKAKFVELNSKTEMSGRQDVDLTKEKFGAVLFGNPGTGKNTVAKLYAKFLSTKRITPGDELVNINGTMLAHKGIDFCSKLLGRFEDGGVFHIEEAHQLMPKNGDREDSVVLNYLLSQVEELQGKVVFVFSGSGKQMDILMGNSPTFSSMIPTVLKFPDFVDSELHKLLIQGLSEKFKAKVEIEGSDDGFYTRIVARRIGRGRGSCSFGNARAVKNVVDQIHARQAKRLFLSMKDGSYQDEDRLKITKEDLIGPPPSTALTDSDAWKKLNRMIGLQSVKETIEALIHRLTLNYECELAEKPLVSCSLNKLFLGNPGTGKTTVAKLYGQILADIGLLSTNEVVFKLPPDFIGDVLGQSESKTKAILESTRGRVLIIDEAYMFGGGGDKSLQRTDQFRTAVIDTIVAEVQSTAVEDRCVLLLGYRDRMEAMLNECNDGLARRFPVASAFNFEDYSQDELTQILDLKLKEQGYQACDQAKQAALADLDRDRNRPNFGNAGCVDNLLDRAKLNQNRRLKNERNTNSDDAMRFLAIDIDPDFERGANSFLNVRELFSEFVGYESILKQFEGYQQIVRNMKANPKDMDGLDPKEIIPFNYLFSGPPGTGKTTTAKKMGELFYDLGFLGSKEVVECSTTDLIGEYLGQTGPKTTRLFDSALGKVLFIDEAYRLSDGSYGKEALSQIVDNLTKDRYRNKLVLILAGYDTDINRMMTLNRGLDSRFPVVLKFPNLTINNCIDLLFNSLTSKKLNVRSIKNSRRLRQVLREKFEKLSSLSSWGNARDVLSLAKTIFQVIISKPLTKGSLAVPEKVIVNEITALLAERSRREAIVQNPVSRLPVGLSSEERTDTETPSNPIPPIQIGTGTKQAEGPKADSDEPQEEVFNDFTSDSDDAERDDSSTCSGDDEVRTEATSPIPPKPDDDGDNDWCDVKKEDLEDWCPDKCTDHVNDCKWDDDDCDWNDEDSNKIQKEKEEELLQEKLNGLCPAGLPWIREGDRYRCTASSGTHYTTLDGSPL